MSGDKEKDKEFKSILTDYTQISTDKSELISSRWVVFEGQKNLSSPL